MYVSTTVCSYFTANCGDYCVVLHPNTVSFLFCYLLLDFSRLQANQSGFILYDVEKINCIKGMYQTDSCKGEKKALLFAPS